jgi:hypothetical protein
MEGTPVEARVSAGLNGLGGADLSRTRGDPHPWYPQMFLTQRKFEHLVKDDTRTQRRTLATFTYKRRPCPFTWEQEEVGTAVSEPMWYSLDEQPKRLVPNSVTAINIMVPKRLMKRRYPSVVMTKEDVDAIHDEVGKVNGSPYDGRESEYWFFQDFRARFLHGLTSGSSIIRGDWELSFMFLGDPVRHHRTWTLKYHDDNGQPLPPPESNAPADMEAAHITRQRNRISEANWETFVPYDDECTVPPED